MSENEITLKNDYIFQDVVISALRYALYRHTYIFNETIAWIRNNSEIINQRVKQVILNDIDRRFDDENLYCNEVSELTLFRDWLMNYPTKEVSK